MSTNNNAAESQLPEAFEKALYSLRDASWSTELTCREVPAPTSLAPFTCALNVHTKRELGGQPIAGGTLVVLYNPDESDLWGADFRLVGQMRAQIDHDMSLDPIFPEAVWASLANALYDSGAEYACENGTVTKEISQTFGGLELRASALNLEVRCSWTALSTDLAPHLEAWCEFVRESAGLPLNTQFHLEVADGR